MANGAEERITRLETADESTLPHLATKADVSRLETKIVLGTVSILAGLIAIIVRLFTQAHPI